MKSHVWAIAVGWSAILLLAVAFLGSLIYPDKLSAAACANTSSFGAVSYNLPQLSNTEDQAIWLRLKSENPESKLLVEINGNECIEIGDFNDSGDGWFWQTYRREGQIVPISFSSANGNTLKIIGISEGIKLDRILVTDKDCRPQEFGNGCYSDGSNNSKDDVIILPPVSDGPISGRIGLSTTPTENLSQLSKVSYMVNGIVVQESVNDSGFDTTLVENGKYTIYITTTLKSGEVIREMMPVEIKNPENAFSLIIRWIRINRRSVSIVAGTVFLLLAIILISRLHSRYRKNKRERSFRGI